MPFNRANAETNNEGGEKVEDNYARMHQVKGKNGQS